MSIFRAMGGVADEFLGIEDDWEGQAPRYSSPTTLQRLSSAWPHFGRGNLVDLLLAACEGLWLGSDEKQRRLTSQANWRRLRCPDCDVNAGPEVQLERLLVRLSDESWWNQVPVESGLLGGGRRTAIDLVRECGDRYSLFELKVASDTPLYAAIEILQYGVAHLFYRRSVMPLLEESDGDLPYMMQAKHIDLIVLAPYSYYLPRYRDWLYALQSRIQNDLLEASATRSLGLPMSFRFESFPKEFEWAANMANQPECYPAVLDALEKRTSPFCC